MALRGLAVVVGGVAVAAAVCWSAFAPAEVSRDQVESGTLSQVAAEPSDAVTCDGGLKARVGAAQTCTLTRDGEQFAVNLQVTDVNGDRVRWDTIIAGAPQSGQRVSVTELQNRTREVLAQQRPVEAVTCDGALLGTVGSTQTCTLTSRGEKHAVEARVVAADPEHVRWGVTVVD